MNRAQKTLEIVARKLKMPLEQVTASTVIEDHCTDSIMFLDMMMTIEKEFGAPPEGIISDIWTVGDLIAAVEQL